MVGHAIIRLTHFYSMLVASSEKFCLVRPLWYSGADEYAIRRAPERAGYFQYRTRTLSGLSLGHA